MAELSEPRITIQLTLSYPPNAEVVTIPDEYLSGGWTFRPESIVGSLSNQPFADPLIAVNAIRVLKGGVSRGRFHFDPFDRRCELIAAVYAEDVDGLVDRLHALMQDTLGAIRAGNERRP